MADPCCDLTGGSFEMVLSMTTASSGRASIAGSWSRWLVGSASNSPTRPLPRGWSGDADDDAAAGGEDPAPPNGDDVSPNREELLDVAMVKFSGKADTTCGTTSVSSRT